MMRHYISTLFKANCIFIFLAQFSYGKDFLVDWEVSQKFNNPTQTAILEISPTINLIDFYGFSANISPAGIYNFIPGQFGLSPGCDFGFVRFPILSRIGKYWMLMDADADRDGTSLSNSETSYLDLGTHLNFHGRHIRLDMYFTLFVTNYESIRLNSVWSPNGVLNEYREVGQTFNFVFVFGFLGVGFELGGKHNSEYGNEKTGKVSIIYDYINFKNVFNKVRY